MLRIFLPLYLILAVFFISFAIATQYLPEILLSDRLNQSAEKMTRGTFYLVEQELKGLSPVQQEKVLADLQTHFKYPIHLLGMDDRHMNDNMREHLRAGKVTYLEDDDDNIFNIFKKMQSSDTVIALYFSDSQWELDHREAVGTYYLIKKRLLNYPQDEWLNIIDELQMHFGVPIRLTLMAGIQLKGKEQQRYFNNGKIIALDHESNQWRFIGKLEGSDYALIIGPIEQAITFFALLSILFFSLTLLLAIALFLWFRPLWQSINELSRTADEFGSGQLKTRAHIKQSAILGNLANQFNTMADRLDGLISGHRELTNAVSHELRTPIARMRFGLDMLEEADDVAKQRFMSGLSSDVDDLESLVNELLHYARFEKSNPMDEQQMIAIVPWLEDVVDNAKGYAKGLKMTCHIQDISKNTSVQFSPRYMARATHNLLRNACKYGNKDIRITLELKEEHVFIHVDDDGQGIPEKERQRIFEAFTRLDKSRDKQTGGHGLGLAITQKIMLAHKGAVSVTDSSSGGARFTLCWAWG